jgi:chromosome transmission fidelity protein 1
MIEALMLGLAGASEGRPSRTEVVVSLFIIDIDGRLIFSAVGDTVEVKYQLLNPSALFRDVVEVARSVVLAGGTMSPVSSFH